LDVERFDLEPSRPIMHGWIDHLDLEAAKRPMSAEEKVPFMLPITGVETLSPRMKASVIELGQTLSTWPQLATSVTLGGALAGDTVRRIALDQFHSSGRWFVDMEELVGDSPPTDPVAASTPPEFKFKAQEINAIFNELGPSTVSTADLDEGIVHQLVEAGGRAPSEGNVQPWKFLWKDRRLLLFHDEARSASVWDPDHLTARLSLGACIENIVLKAHSLTLEVGCRMHPFAATPRLAAAFEFGKFPFRGAEPHEMDQLAPQIAARRTARKITARKTLPEGVLTHLRAAATSVQGCQLHVADAPARLQELAQLCGAAERLRLLNPEGHREYFRNHLRWDAQAANRTRDGIDVRTLELPPAALAALRMASDRRAMDLLKQWNAGNALGQLSAFSVMAASAVVLLTHARKDPTAQLDAGRSLERCWLTASSLGLSVQPISTALVTGGASPGGHAWDQGEWGSIRRRFLQFWDIPGENPLVLLRIGMAGEPSTQTLRRPSNQLFV
jgi:nitroreductase